MLVVGDFVDDFTLEDQQGRRRTLNELLQNGTLVAFFMQRVMTPG